MSFMEVKHVIERIKTATPSSPIAVFRGGGKNQVNAVFADTVYTQQMIANHDPTLIGVYDGSMNLGDIAQTLRKNVG